MKRDGNCYSHSQNKEHDSGKRMISTEPRVESRIDENIPQIIEPLLSKSERLRYIYEFLEN